MNNDRKCTFTTIQCDWEDFIDVPYKSIWIWRKEEGQKSIECTVQGGTVKSNNDDFTVSLARSSLAVRHNPSGEICNFIPAFKQFSKIHEKAVYSVDAANGGLGLSCGGEGKLQVWDNLTGEVRRELAGHVGEVYKCRLFPSGVVALSAAADLRIKIWSAESGQSPVTLVGHTRAVVDLAIIDRGRNIVSVSKDGTARLWHCGEGSCIGTVLSTNYELTCCDIGEVPVGTSEGTIENPKEIGTSDKILLVGSEEGIVYGVLLGPKVLSFTVSCPAAVNAILYFSRDIFMVGTKTGHCLLYGLKDGLLVRSIQESSSPILSMARFLDKGVLIGRQDGTVTYFNPLSDTTDRIHLTGPNFDPVYAISVTTDYVYTGCRDGKIRQYKLADILAAGA